MATKHGSRYVVILKGGLLMRRSYDKQFKVAAVKLVVEDDMPLAMLQIISTMTVTTITAKMVAQMIRFLPLFCRTLQNAFSKIYIGCSLIFLV